MYFDPIRPHHVLISLLDCLSRFIWIFGCPYYLFSYDFCPKNVFLARLQVGIGWKIAFLRKKRSNIETKIWDKKISKMIFVVPQYQINHFGLTSTLCVKLTSQNMDEKAWFLAYCQKWLFSKKTFLILTQGTILHRKWGCNRKFEDRPFFRLHTSYPYQHVYTAVNLSVLPSTCVYYRQPAWTTVNLCILSSTYMHCW